MALMQIAIIPLGTGTPSVSRYVADLQDVLAQSGMPYKLTDMATIIEGPSKELLELAAQLSETCFSKGVDRVVTQITLDDRRDKNIHLGDKIASVEAHLSPKE